MELIDIGSSYIFMCPHCDGQIEVNKKNINCSIFRHGVYKKTLIKWIRIYVNSLVTN